MIGKLWWDSHTVNHRRLDNRFSTIHLPHSPEFDWIRAGGAGCATSRSELYVSVYRRSRMRSADRGRPDSSCKSPSGIRRRSCQNFWAPLGSLESTWWSDDDRLLAKRSWIWERWEPWQQVEGRGWRWMALFSWLEFGYEKMKWLIWTKLIEIDWNLAAVAIADAFRTKLVEITVGESVWRADRIRILKRNRKEILNNWPLHAQSNFLKPWDLSRLNPKRSSVGQWVGGESNGFRRILERLLCGALR